MILPSIYGGRNRNLNRKESDFFFTDSDSKPGILITLLIAIGLHIEKMMTAENFYFYRRHDTLLCDRHVLQKLFFYISNIVMVSL